MLRLCDFMQLHSHMLRLVAVGLVACSADTGGLTAPVGTTGTSGADVVSTGDASLAPTTSGDSSGGTSTDETGVGSDAMNLSYSEHRGVRAEFYF